MKSDKTASLTDTVKRVVCQKGTERPYSGEYDQFGDAGSYLCRQCGLALFRSASKFHSGCGWPSFDEEIAGAVKRTTDNDGKRTEILCQRCNAHLGHVFTGEGFTKNNTRHCVNSLSLDFVPDMAVIDTKEAILAAGCFWGVEYYLKRLPGVLKTEVGYTGGHLHNPTYQDVCRGDSGHYEAVRVIYDPNKINYEQLIKTFFEIHDPTQRDGQGPDIGQQYLSVIFYYDTEQQSAAEEYITSLAKKGLNIATLLIPVSIFWRAENYHQNYCEKNNLKPHCHPSTR